jgi:hypothetical protein
MKPHRGSWTGRTRKRLGMGVSMTKHRHPQLWRRISRLEVQQKRTRKALSARLAELETSLQEQRRLSLRVAELTDIVTELVGAAARGGGAEFERALERYRESL